ncbi:MAG: bifunctional UDP-N-acetylglucosamine diphosphorylase/glucosamine-1-phosphate N-acetyltransferase GlmU, partial [Pseudomonadota bacterium]
ANREIRQIREINTGIMAAKRDRLDELLEMLNCDNAQGEYLLTDIVAGARAKGLRVAGESIDDAGLASGVNNRAQLAELERIYQRRRADELMVNGVTLADPMRFDMRGFLTVGEDSFIDINCVFNGSNRIGKNVCIGPNCVITDSTIADDVVIEANCVIESADIAKRCAIGPFARMRPGTIMQEASKLGNFVETKNSEIGPGSKVNHLAYVGDSDVSESVNIGAGVITANYDGANKHRTHIEEGVFVGSNAVLVAPIRIGAGATVGAGSTVSRDVPENELVVARAKPRSVANWQRPQKNKPKENK